MSNNILREVTKYAKPVWTPATGWTDNLSKGHIGIETVTYDDGRTTQYEYFLHVDNAIYRAPMSNVIDIHSGYRLGARFYGLDSEHTRSQLPVTA